jgi:peptide/nickel transport system permease protein
MRRLVHRPLAVACLAYVAALIAVAVIAPIVMPSVIGEHAGDLLASRQGPGMHHLLGTDALGRDVLARLLVGSRVTVVGVAYALVVVLLLGVPMGVAAGFIGGWLDRIVGWLADLTFSVPAIIVILVVLAVYPQSMLAAMITLGVLAAPGLMRVVRSATLPIRKELYIDAAQVSGLSRPYIIARHVLPRVSGAIIVQISLLSAVALLVQTGLSFLNLIVAPPAPSWGGMVADGVTSLVLQPWLIWPPGVAIAVTVVAFGLLGDQVRDASAEGWAAGHRRRRKRAAVTSVAPRAGGRKNSAAALSAPRQDVSALLSVAHLSAALPSPAGSVGVLEDVTFDIGVGEIVGLVGESGCGKTMTAMAILGLLPAGGHVTGGSIWFDGQDLAAGTERELRQVRGKQIALISQDPMVSLNPVFRVGWQLAEALRYHRGLSRRAARAEAVELLRKVRLPQPEVVARQYPHELSGGMAQRVSIARALTGEPRLLIADEPTTALDVTVQEEILDLLRELQRERRMGMLFVTHDWGVVADICDRAVVMYAGEVVERAPLVPIFHEPLHPYTKALLSSNPHYLSGGQDLPTIPGTVPAAGAWPGGCRFHPRCGYATVECRTEPVRIELPSPGRETRCIHYDELIPTRSSERS